jgi:hypothetical protein
MRSLLLAAVLVSAPAWAQPVVDGCPVLPANDIWNVPVDTLPLDAKSASYVTSIGAAVTVHPDFGAGNYQGAPIGIPFVSVPGTQAPVAIHLKAYDDESDPGPYPVPPSAPVEGGNGSTGDRHVIVVDRGACKLYELYRAFRQTDNSWNADQGSIYDLNSHALRQDGWTSADAAGLPIFPGLARYEEVAAGEIRHALRFTAPSTRKAYVWPARHYASDKTNTSLPPMGQRFRLRANAVDPASFSPQAQVIVRALMKYGMILADNGSAWYISGAPNAGWDNDQLVSELKRLKGSFFEAVDVSSLQVDPDSGETNVDGDPQPPPPASIRITAPNGGEVWKIGTSYKLLWTSTGVTGKVKIELSKDGGVTWKVVAKASLNDGKQGYKMVAPAAARARYRISSVDQPQVTDTSDGDFKIQ